jgi:HEAT repeat protein
MSENPSVQPAWPASGSEAGPKPARRRHSAGRTLIVLVVFGGVLLWAARLLWENRHPALAAARGLRASAVADRLTAVRDVTAAGTSDTAVAIPSLTPALRDQDASVRTTAIESLGLLISYSIRSRASEREAREAIAALMNSLKDPQPNVRLAAINVLSMIRTTTPNAPRQTPKKDDEKPTPLIDANVMITAMTEMAADHDPLVRAAAVRSLCDASATDPASGFPAATVALVDEDPDVRAMAAEGVGRLIAQAIRNKKGESEAAAALAKLLAARKDRDAGVRTAAIGALSTITSTANRRRPRHAEKGAEQAGSTIDTGSFIAGFVESLGDQEAAVNLAAARALVALEPSAIPESAVSSLVAALKSRDSEVRLEVLRVLSQLGSRAVPAIPAFIAALKESADADRSKAQPGARGPREGMTGPAYVAAEALGKIAPTTPAAGEAVTALTEALASGPPDRRPSAASALGEFGAKATPAIPALVKFLQESLRAQPASEDGSSAAVALGQIAPGTPSASAAVTALNEAVKSNLSDTRVAATKALERFSPTERKEKP